MLSIDWNGETARIPKNRIFEYTEPHIAEQFQQEGEPNLGHLSRLPCLFMVEGVDDEKAFVGQISRTRISEQDVLFEYTFDYEVPPLKNRTIYEHRAFLDMSRDWEFSRNHWAVKEIDLYRYLIRNSGPRRQRPSVFQLQEHENIEPTLASAMMPFEARFDAVYVAIQNATQEAGLRCRRADDIWDNPAIIQDVVSLIDRSRVVICDCTDRNPNVFYEAGIAHTLGREVILITQSHNDIPFDLRHLRYIHYLNNQQGLEALIDALRDRVQTIIGH